MECNIMFGQPTEIWKWHKDTKCGENPITGIGQGNRMGPQIWAAVSTPLFQILVEEGFLATIICAISIHKCSIVGFSFVNDTDLCITVADNKLPTVLHRMQQSLQMWANLLQVMGGALVPEKCFWYFVKPEWQQNTAKWTYADPDPSHRLHILDDEGNLEVIPQLKASEAQQTLGVRLAPNGNDKAEFQHLVETSRQWQQSMVTARVTHSTAEFGMHQMIFWKLEYPLVATTFTQQQCIEIMHPILAQCLPLAGFVRSFARAIVHCPWQWGGLNILNLYMQVIAHFTHSTEVWWTIRWHHRQPNSSIIGSTNTQSSLVGDPATFLDTIQDYITRTWVANTWMACQRANKQIIRVQSQFRPKRLCNTKLMQLFIWHGYRKNKLAGLNQCLMYIHAIFILDICTATGDVLKQYMWKQPTQITSQYLWLVIPKPTPSEWTTWQWALQQTFSLGTQQLLPLPLGRWHRNSMATHKQFYSPLEEAVYQHDNAGWHRHAKIPQWTCTKVFHRSSQQYQGSPHKATYK